VSVADLFVIPPYPLNGPQGFQPLVHPDRRIYPSDRFPDQIGNGATLFARQRLETLVQVVLEVELGTVHSMYIHRHTYIVNPQGRYPAIFCCDLREIPRDSQDGTLSAA
jgi:hypothetical protein